MTHLLLALLVLGLAHPAWACPAPVAPAAVAARLDHAEAAYAALLGAPDEDAAWSAFLAHVDAVHEALPCLSAALPPALAARVHAVEGLRRFGEGDARGAALAWRAARRADAALELGAGWMTPHDPERTLWATSGDAPAGAVPLPPPRRARLVLDGRITAHRPEAQAVVWQVLRRDGRVLQSLYLPPHAPTPPYRRAASPGAWALTGAGAGLLVAGGALLGTGLGYWQRACRPRLGGGCHPADHLTSRQVQRLVEVGVPVGGATAGVGVAALTGGSLWVALSGRPGGAAVAVGGRL